MSDERPPCPVCGHPHGDCGPGRDPGRILFSEWEEPQMQPKNPIGEETPVVCREQVWEDFLLPNGTKSRKLAHAPGERISVAEAIRLDVPLLDAEGRAIQAPKRAVETQEVKAPRKAKR